MDMVITIPEPLAHTLRAIATQRGISAEAMTWQMLVAGLATLQAAPDAAEAPTQAVANCPLFPPLRFEAWSLPPLDPTDEQFDSTDERIVELGTLHSAPLSDGFVFTMPSPIIASSPVPMRSLVLPKDTHDTGPSNAD